MDAKQYCEVITTFERYFLLFEKKRGQLKTTFENGRIGLESDRYMNDGANTFIVRSKHGIICDATPYSTDPEHWSNDGNFIGRTIVSQWDKHNTLVLNNGGNCKYSHEFVIGNGYGVDSVLHDDLLDATCVEDLEGIIFQQSMISDFSEEYGIACLHKAGLLLKKMITFNLRLTSHLGSTDETVLGLIQELKEYMKYVR